MTAYAAHTFADPTASLATAEGADPAERRVAHLAMLDRLAQAAMNIALEMERRVLEASPPPTTVGEDAPSAASARPERGAADLAMAFDRAARSVRQTLAVYDRIANPPAARAAAAAPSPAPSGRFDAPARRPVTEVLEDIGWKFTVAGAFKPIIEQAARAMGKSDIDIKYLVLDAGNLLARMEESGDLLRQPIEQTIEQICRELGLEPPDYIFAAGPAEESELEPDIGDQARAGADPPDAAEILPDPLPVGWSSRQIDDWQRKAPRNGWP